MGFDATESDRSLSLPEPQGCEDRCDDGDMRDRLGPRPDPKDQSDEDEQCRSDAVPAVGVLTNGDGVGPDRREARDAPGRGVHRRDEEQSERDAGDRPRQEEGGAEGAMRDECGQADHERGDCSVRRSDASGRGRDVLPVTDQEMHGPVVQGRALAVDVRRRRHEPLELLVERLELARRRLRPVIGEAGQREQ